MPASVDAAYYSSNGKHGNERHRHVPDEDHRREKLLSVVVRLPWFRTGSWRVQDPAYLPEPGSLDKNEERPTEGDQDAVSVTYFRYARNYGPYDSVQ